METNNLAIEDFKNHKVKVVGTVTEYNSKLELILSSGDSLKMINN